MRYFQEIISDKFSDYTIQKSRGKLVFSKDGPTLYKCIELEFIPERQSRLCLTVRMCAKNTYPFPGPDQNEENYGIYCQLHGGISQVEHYSGLRHPHKYGPTKQDLKENTDGVRDHFLQIIGIVHEIFESIQTESELVSFLLNNQYFMIWVPIKGEWVARIWRGEISPEDKEAKAEMEAKLVAEIKAHWERQDNRRRERGLEPL
jgi:hypothetical protein